MYIGLYAARVIHEISYTTPVVHFIPAPLTNGARHNEQSNPAYARRLHMLRAPPSVWSHLFCGAGHEKRRGEQLKWSLAFRLYTEVFHVHSYQDQFIQPGWAECVFVCAYLA